VVGFFEKSVGVANVRRFAGRLGAEPKYVTRKSAGAGFAELAERLLTPPFAGPPSADP